MDLNFFGPKCKITGMEIVQTLAPIASRACHLEALDAQDAGKFLRILCVSAGLDDGLIQLLFEHILNDLVETDLLESCEFHEALDGILPSESLTELLVGAFDPQESVKLAEVISKLHGGEVFKPAKSDWQVIRKNMSAVDFRNLAVSIAESSCEKPHHIPRLLLEMYDLGEEYEIAETTRMLLERNWILDILPQTRKAARQILYKQFVTPYPFMSKPVADFCRDMLRLSPLEKEANSDSSPSSDSDIESRGSLDGFIVDSEEDESSGSGSIDSDSEESASSDESFVNRKKKRESSSDESESSEESFVARKKKRDSSPKRTRR